MELLNGATITVTRTGKYLWQVEAGTGTAKLTLTDQGGNVETDITNSLQSIDFTGILNLGERGIVTAVITGDAKCALSFADN